MTESAVRPLVAGVQPVAAPARGAAGAAPRPAANASDGTSSNGQLFAELR